MAKYYCLDVEFPDIDFNPIYIRTDIPVRAVHHAHLFARQDEIELRIYYDSLSYFGEKLSSWAAKIDWKKFGKFIKVTTTQNQTNEGLQGIDLSEASLCGVTTGSNLYEGKEKYVAVKKDTVKIYRNPTNESVNTGEFYFDDKGFRVVEPFYGLLLPKSHGKNDGRFELNRLRDSTKFYRLGNSSFRPEFDFATQDSRRDRSASIVKEPKIQFRFHKGVTEQQTILYGDVVLMLASFYYHLKIDYILRRIHLPDHTITIRTIEQKNYFDRKGDLWGFGIYWDFNEFLQTSWQKVTLKNYSILSKAIKLFNQSHLVDDSSAFLIRYNIIEVCNKQKLSAEKFSISVNKKQAKKMQNEALNTLLGAIQPSEHEQFKRRWENVQTLLKNKPMKNQLISFLENQGLEPEKLPIKIKDLKDLRNYVTHGSVDKIDHELLKKANILLYRICGILILNLMGISDWKLDTEIN